MSRKTFDIAELLLLLGIIVFTNIIFSDHFFRIDLTGDQRYSISPDTRQTVGALKDVLFVEVFLGEELAPDYERLRKAIREKLNELRLYSNGKVEYRFTDPNAIEDKKVREQFFAQLIQKGVQYHLERIDQAGKVEEKIIFPSALLSYEGKEVPVVFLKGSKILPVEQQLNQSVEGIEFELMSAIRKLSSKVTKSLAFVEGHGTLSKDQVADISSTLSEYYNVDRISLSDSPDLSHYQALILAGPTEMFPEKEKFLLDQYVVGGGNLMVLADALNVNADSLMHGYTYAFPHNTGLEELFFKYGLRLNQDLIEDVNCALIKVATGNGSQTEAVNWPFYPILYNYGKHPVVKNLDALLSRYIGSIDTVRSSGIVKTPLVFTTARTRTIAAPTRLDLNETRKSLQHADFNKGVLCVSYLLEGSFESAYKNRPSPIPGRQVVVKGKKARMIVCSDSDLIRNEFDKARNKVMPLGYDATISYEFSNKDFLLHAIDYLMDESILNIRNKEIALRPLDKVRVAEGKFFWQMLNLVLPASLIIFFGLLRYILRKRKYEN